MLVKISPHAVHGWAVVLLLHYVFFYRVVLRRDLHLCILFCSTSQALDQTLLLLLTQATWLHREGACWPNSGLRHTYNVEYLWTYTHSIWRKSFVNWNRPGGYTIYTISLGIDRMCHFQSPRQDCVRFLNWSWSFTSECHMYTCQNRRTGQRYFMVLRRSLFWAKLTVNAWLGNILSFFFF